MNISPVEEYSLRCLIQLARHEDRPVTIREIGQEEGLSTAYVAKLLNLLQKKDLVHGLRGVQGGYLLSKKAQEISLSEIFRAAQSFEEVCGKYTGGQTECVHAGHCEIKTVWDQLARHIFGFLDRISLADLAQGKFLPGAGAREWEKAKA
jgi:Rrf2 family iron-sulfur cluster assembly transcriptional regulator